MADVPHRAKKTKKNRKYGRNAIACASYKNSNRRERNKIIKLKKHLVRFPDDKVAAAAVEGCKVAVRGH